MNKIKVWKNGKKDKSVIIEFKGKIDLFDEEVQKYDNYEVILKNERKN